MTSQTATMSQTSNIPKWIETEELSPIAAPAPPKRTILGNPMIPLGLLATVTCLALGLKSMVQGRKHLSQLYMRGRVACQALTVVAIVYGTTRTKILETREENNKKS